MAKSALLSEPVLAPSLDASQLSSMADSDIKPVALPNDKLTQMYRDMICGHDLLVDGGFTAV